MSRAWMNHKSLKVCGNFPVKLERSPERRPQTGLLVLGLRWACANQEQRAIVRRGNVVPASERLEVMKLRCEARGLG
jgi:hypothetical protein